jgi:hypothetical protein
MTGPIEFARLVMMQALSLILSTGVTPASLRGTGDVKRPGTDLFTFREAQVTLQITPGSRDSGKTIHQLLDVHDHSDVVEATGGLNPLAGFGSPGRKAARPDE